MKSRSICVRPGKAWLPAALAAIVVGCAAFPAAADVVTSSSPGNASAVVGEGASLGNADSQSGAAVTSFPFALPSPRGEAGPRLGLAYSSNAREGEAGLGWSLSLPSITRSRNPHAATAEFPTATDRYQFAGQELLPAGSGDYKLQGDPDRATFHLDVDRWTVTHKGGLVEVYGRTEASREMTGPYPVQFNLSSRTDRNGNSTTYLWSKDPLGTSRGRGKSYLTHIYYNQRAGRAGDEFTEYEHHVAIRWEEPDGVFHSQMTPTWIATPGYRITRVDVYSKPPSGLGTREVVRRYHLTYLKGDGSTPRPPISGRSFLRTVQMEGRCIDPVSEPPNPNPSEQLPTDEPTQTCARLPATTFAYESPIEQPFQLPTMAVSRLVSGSSFNGLVSAYDINGDGFPDLVDPFRHAFRNVQATPGASHAFVEDCVASSMPTSPSIPYPVSPDSLFHPRYGMTVPGPWNHALGGLSVLFRGVDSSGTAPTSSWGGARIATSTTPCIGFMFPDAGGPRRTWDIKPFDTLDVSVGTKVGLFAPDINGDGVPDSVTASNSSPHTYLDLLISRRRLGAGASSKHLDPYGTILPKRLLYFNYAEQTPGVRSFADMDGDGIADAVSTDRYQPGDTPSYYGMYGASPGNLHFIEKTRISYLPGVGDSYECSSAKEPACKAIDRSFPDFEAEPTPQRPLDTLPPVGPIPGSLAFMEGGRYFSGNKIHMGCVTIRTEGEIQNKTFDADNRIVYDHDKDPVRSVAFGDVNGDGFSDVVAMRQGPTSYFFSVYINEGGRKLRRYCDGDPTGETCSDATDPSLTISTSSPTGFVPRFMLVDIDASGADDIVVVEPSEVRALSVVRRGKPGALTSIFNGRGASTTFAYDTYQDHAEIQRAARGESELAVEDRLPMVAHVVTSVQVSNGLDGVAAHHATTTYHYRRPSYDAWTQTFKGFGGVTVVHPGGNATSDSYVYGPCERSGGCPSTGDDDPRSIHGGRLVSSVEFASDPTVGAAKKSVLKQTLLEYEARVRLSSDPNRNFWTETLKRKTVRLIDDKATASQTPSVVVRYPNSETYGPTTTETITTWSGMQDRVLVTEWDYDGNTNVAEIRERGEVNGASPFTPKDEVIRRTYTYNEVAPKVWRAVETTVAGDPGVAVRHTRSQYDARGNALYAEAELSGSVALQRSHKDGGATAPLPSSSTSGWVRLKTAEYDTFGNVTASYGPTVETVAGARQVESKRITFDTEYGHHVVASTVELDGRGSGPGRTLTTTYLVDRGFGVVTEVNTPNFERTRFRYDYFGRPVDIADPSPSFPLATQDVPARRWSYDIRTGFSRVHVWSRDPTDTTGVGRETIDYIDGLGITRLSLSQGEGTSWDASGVATYNARGQVVTSSAHAWVYQGGLDEPYLEFGPDSVYVTRTYDSFGRPTSVWEGPPAGVNVGTRALSRTEYSPLRIRQYGAPGLDQSSASLGTNTVADTDGHGRVRSVEEVANSPSSVTHYDYLPTGEVIRQQRGARGGSAFTVRERWFDTLGRMVRQTEPNTTTPTKPLVYAYNDAGWLVGTSDSRGCGVNVGYDAVGREVLKDVSPCASTQPAYTPVAAWGTPDFGDGTESFNVYDAAEPGETGAEYGASASLPGRLVATYDRGSHVRYRYDTLGRVTRVGRRVVRPAAPTPDLASRYTSHWFAKETSYDENGRIVRSTSGADVPELLVAGASAYEVGYGARGNISHISSSHGSLIDSSVARADGRLDSVTYGDSANTTVWLTYYEGRVSRPLMNVTVNRGGSAPWSSAGYTPADPTEPTQQLELSNATYLYDAADRPTAIIDNLGADWPTGAKQRQQHAQYDDLGRITHIDYTYTDSARTSPFAEENAAGSTRHAPRTALPYRANWQTFAYDYQGNITQSLGDSGTDGKFDRQLGAEAHGTATSGPNQLREGDGTKVSYDLAGNVTDIAVERPGPCEASRPCTQRYHYTWDEVGQLSRAERWDLTLTSGQSANDAWILAQPPTWAVDYAYSQGQRILRSSHGPLGEHLHTVDVFDSLRLEDATFDGEYTRDASTEQATLAGIGLVRAVGTETPDGASAGDVRLFLKINDALGSSTTVIDHQTGEVVEHTSYDSHGALDSDYRPSRWGHFRDAHKFTGKEEDVEVGIVYFGARYYHPNLRRWMSPDPLTIHGWGADPNPYAYVNGNPLGAVDPYGLESSRGSNGSDWIGIGEAIGGLFDWIGGLFSSGDDSDADASPRRTSSRRTIMPPPGPPKPPPDPSVDARYGALYTLAMPEIKAGVAAMNWKTFKWGVEVLAWEENAWSQNVMWGGIFAGAVATRGHSVGEVIEKITGVPRDSFVGASGRMAGDVVGGALEANPGAVGTLASEIEGRLVAREAQAAAEGTGAFLEGAQGGAGLGKLAGRSIQVSEKGLAIVESHLAQFGPVPANTAMVGRLQQALASGARISGADASFYLHEVSEATMMGRGLSYEAAHAGALGKYGVSPFSVYHPEVIMANPGSFNSNWLKFWGIQW